MNGVSAAGHAPERAGPRAGGGLTVDVAAAEAAHAPGPDAVRTPPGVRGQSDLRSPGVQKTPRVAAAVWGMA